MSQPFQSMRGFQFPHVYIISSLHSIILQTEQQCFIHQTMPYTRLAMKKQETPKRSKPAVTVSNISVEAHHAMTTSAKNVQKLTGPKPSQGINPLSWNQHVHTPHACDYIHRQHNRPQHSQFPQYVRCLLLALVHPNVDLSKVIRVSARE